MTGNSLTVLTSELPFSGFTSIFTQPASLQAFFSSSLFFLLFLFVVAFGHRHNYLMSAQAMLSRKFLRIQKVVHLECFWSQWPHIFSLFGGFSGLFIRFPVDFETFHWFWMVFFKLRNTYFVLVLLTKMSYSASKCFR